MTKALSSIEFTTLFAGITLMDVQAILSMALMGISIVIGIINLIILFKKFLEDGKIDDNEKKQLMEASEQILTEVEKLKEQIDDNNNNRN